MQALAERMIRDELLQLDDHLAVVTELELGLDPKLLRREALLLKAGDTCLGEAGEGNIGERRPAPQRQRVAKHAARGERIAGVERATGLRNELGEAITVQLTGPDLQAIARR